MEKVKSSPLLVSLMLFLLTALFAEVVTGQQEGGNELLNNQFLQEGWAGAVSILNMITF